LIPDTATGGLILGVYFFLFWLLFLMLYNILDGFFRHVKEGFWGYHDRITERIDRYTVDASIYGQDEMLVNALRKQQKELEDIMGQYVFYRFCERITVYMAQIDIVLLFCISMVSVIFIHSAWINNEYWWMAAWIAAYGLYMWNEISGAFIKFEVWATNIFLKQYKVLSRSGGASNIIDAKKSNKVLLRNFYLFLILPISVAALLLLFLNVIYPLLPKMQAALQADILLMWMYFAVPGAAISAAMPVILDKVLNARLKYAFDQVKQSYYVVTIYLFISLAVATVISVSKYII
jgi:hypothetical protein